MSSVIDVTLENFEEVVVQGSMTRAVVVDFCSNRSAPSQQQSLVLEKLSKELDFVLAKVDIEKAPQIVSYFQVASVPDLRVVSQGQIADTLPGQQPEGLLRKRLGKFFLSEADKALLEAETLIQQGHPAEAIPQLDALLAAKPNDKKVLYCKAKALVDLGQGCQATELLNQFSEGDDFYREAKALRELMAFHEECAKKDLSDPLDLEYQRCCSLALQGQYRESLDALLGIVQKQRNWRDDSARKAMLTLFGVLGPKHELTWEFRSRLNSILFI